jgi:phage tail-like protein
MPKTKSVPVVPFKNFKFLVYFSDSNDPVLGVSKVSALKRSTDVVSHREGGDQSTQRHSPGRSNFEPITLERGLTLDRRFEDWANKVYSDGATLEGYKRDIRIEVMNVQNKPVMAYKVYRAWVKEYTALPELDANANASMLETIVLQNEGWERDEAVTGPDEV